MIAQARISNMHIPQRPEKWLLERCSSTMAFSPPISDGTPNKDIVACLDFPSILELIQRAHYHPEIIEPT